MNRKNDTENTDWTAWYFALLAFLLVQLLAYSLITKFYE